MNEGCCIFREEGAKNEVCTLVSAGNGFVDVNRKFKIAIESDTEVSDRGD